MKTAQERRQAIESSEADCAASYLRAYTKSMMDKAEGNKEFSIEVEILLAYEKGWPTVRKELGDIGYVINLKQGSDCVFIIQW